MYPIYNSEMAKISTQLHYIRPAQHARGPNVAPGKILSVPEATGSVLGPLNNYFSKLTKCNKVGLFKISAE
jgi:hypothetical protein